LHEAESPRGKIDHPHPSDQAEVEQECIKIIDANILGIMRRVHGVGFLSRYTILVWKPYIQQQKHQKKIGIAYTYKE